jgi:uncharacterized membrane protein YdjX (TVP38/TMEM64 family)
LGYRKLLLLLAVWAASVTAFIIFREKLTLAELSRHEANLVAFRDARPILCYTLAFLLYAILTSLPVPAAGILNVAYGWFFRFGPAVILLSFASLMGAVNAFLLSRYLLRDVIQHRFGDRLATVNAALEREGVFYLFMLRVVPIFPFFVVNPVMGLTRMPLRTFCWVTQLGMLPVTCIFVWAGSQFPSLSELSEQGARGILKPQLFLALLVLGLFPLVAKKLYERFRPTKS